MSKQIRIKDVTWTYFKVPHLRYVSQYGADSVAQVNKHRKEIIFDISHIDLPTVIHEVTHAFIASCLIDSCNHISFEDLEEVFCEINSYHLDDIKKVSNKIFKALGGGRKK